MDKQRKKQRRRYIAWGCAGVLVLTLAVLPMVAAGGEDTPQASILSGQVVRQDLDTRISGGGLLSAEAAVSLDIPAEVKITDYLVGNGDTVQEGDPIALVDRVSVMTAIAAVQETLDYLSEEITAASSGTAPETVTAQAGGTVKILYAASGDSVSQVMLEHGALAVLSLDNQMAVEIQSDAQLVTGQEVTVTLSDGTQATGEVKSNIAGTITVTLEDEDYEVGQTVTVSTAEGETLGQGVLEIHSPWKAGAYTGTVGTVSVTQGQTVSKGQTLMTLTDTGHTAEYQQLVDQRQDYQELMQELFILYDTQTVTAPCDGIVTGVDTDGAYLLSGGSAGGTLQLLSQSGESQGFVIAMARVTGSGSQGLELDISAPRQWSGSLKDLPGVDSSALTAHWSWTGSGQVYAVSDQGVLEPAGQAQAGDNLIVVGNTEQALWLVEAGSGDSSAPDLLSSTDTVSAEEVPAAEEPQPAAVMESVPETQPTLVTEPVPETQPTLAAEPVPETQPTETTPPAGDLPAQTGLTITTQSLPQANAGQPYSAQLQAANGGNPVSGTWSVSGLPEGVTLDPGSGLLTGTPAAAGEYPLSITFTDGTSTVSLSLTLTVAAAPQTYWGYVAWLVAVGGGEIQVQQTPYAYTITDLQNLPQVSAAETDLTVEKTYAAGSVDLSALTAGQTVLLIVDQQGNLAGISAQAVNAGGPTGGMTGGMDLSGMMGSGGGMSGGTGSTAPAFTPYTLETVSIGSVTSQNHMKVEITVDEQDVALIHQGQEAQVTIDALGSESFTAAVSRISNSGTNEGGSSKFTVELTLEKSGEMLPGMTASAFLTVDTQTDVLCVPAAAVEQLGSQSVVYTGYDPDSQTLLNPVVVTTGVSDGDMVEILDGLGDGSSFCYAYYENTQTSPAVPDLP